MGSWFTGLTVLINLSVLNKRGLVFIFGFVSHCEGEVNFGSREQNYMDDAPGGTFLLIFQWRDLHFADRKGGKNPHNNPHSLMQWDTGY